MVDKIEITKKFESIGMFDSNENVDDFYNYLVVNDLAEIDEKILEIREIITNLDNVLTTLEKKYPKKINKNLLKIHYYSLIENFKSRDLISKVDLNDCRSNRNQALFKLAKNDFIVLDDIYLYNEHVNQCRKNGFSFTFKHYIIIAYYPIDNSICCYNYHTTN